MTTANTNNAAAAVSALASRVATASDLYVLVEAPEEDAARARVLEFIEAAFGTDAVEEEWEEGFVLSLDASLEARALYGLENPYGGAGEEDDYDE